jgi:nitrogen-specific signal transduction histidine kinase
MNQPPKMARAEIDFVHWHSDLERIFTLFSCETRNPIQSSWGALSVIQRRADPEDEFLTRAVRIIKEETGQLHELVQEYLEFVRPVEARQITTVDLNALLNRVLTIVHHNNEGSAVSLSHFLDPALPQLPADYEEIKRAFLHIIKNSYGVLSEKGGDLAVETRFSPTPAPGYLIATLTVKGPGVT